MIMAIDAMENEGATDDAGFVILCDAASGSGYLCSGGDVLVRLGYGDSSGACSGPDEAEAR